MQVVQRKPVPVHIQVHGKALDADRVHLKIQNVRGHRDVLLASRQDAVDELLVRPHVRRGGSGRFQIAAALHIHGQSDLQQIIFKENGVRFVVLSDMDRDLQPSVLSRQFFGADLFPVQRIGNGDFPGNLFGTQVPLIKKFPGLRVHGDGSLPGLDPGVGGQIFHGLIIPVIHDLRILLQPVGVYHVNAVHAPVLLQVHIYVFLLGGTARRLQRRRASRKQRAAQHDRRSAAEGFSVSSFHAPTPLISMLRHFSVLPAPFLFSRSVRSPVKIRVKGGPSDQPVSQHKQRGQHEDHQRKG